MPLRPLLLSASAFAAKLLGPEIRSIFFVNDRFFMFTSAWDVLPGFASFSHLAACAPHSSL